ncbi:MAG TPA: hypothetical protein VL283_02890 [Candidatus Baltobacteraceae bacterium]|nr:hypothetical protein [Candidatus Baltobacteraceae bacterium]
MRSFELTAQIERLTASGIGRIQGISDEVYRNIWPKTAEMPAKHEERFDRALIVDAFPLYPMYNAVDHGDRRVTLPVRLLPLRGRGKPTAFAFGREDEPALAPLEHRQHAHLLRYVIFWQAGERWKGSSPNAMRTRFDPDECGLRLNEGLHLALQEEELLKKRRLPLSDRMNAHGETHFVQWDGLTPSFTFSYGMFAELEGVPSRAREVIPVSTEDQDFFLKE